MKVKNLSFPEGYIYIQLLLTEVNTQFKSSWLVHSALLIAFLTFTDFLASYSKNMGSSVKLHVIFSRPSFHGRVGM